jgi:hypothetical protein
MKKLLCDPAAIITKLISICGILDLQNLMMFDSFAARMFLPLSRLTLRLNQRRSQASSMSHAPGAVCLHIALGEEQRDILSAAAGSHPDDL